MARAFARCTLWTAPLTSTISLPGSRSLAFWGQEGMVRALGIFHFATGLSSYDGGGWE